MMFLSHIAFSLELIALALGVFLMSCSFNKEERCTKWVKKIGALIILLSILGMICTSYYVFKYWLQGSFETSSGVSMQLDKKTTDNRGNMYNMEHLQNMGSQQSMEHMETK